LKRRAIVIDAFGIPAPVRAPKLVDPLSIHSTENSEEPFELFKENAAHKVA